MLTGIVDSNGVIGGCWAGSLGSEQRRTVPAVRPQRLAGMAVRATGDYSRWANTNNCAAGATTVRAEIDNPIGSADDNEVVLDNDE